MSSNGGHWTLRFRGSLLVIERLSNDNGKVAARDLPEDWRVARGSNWHNLRGYRNVQVRPNGVIHYFPPSRDLVLPSENLGPPRNPHLPGWMSVSDAAYWIASEGGRISFSLRNLQKWQEAFYLLLPLISSSQISVIGRRHGRGLATTVPGASFAGLAVDYPYSDTRMDLLLCERPHLQCYGIGDAEHWEKTFNDCLMSEDRHVPEYSHLQVSNSDLARVFPFLPPAIKSLNSSRNLQGRIREVVARLWPNGIGPARVKDRNAAIAADFKSKGETAPDDRTIRRALKS